MKYDICGNCDYCDKKRSNDKGQVRCARFRCYVPIDGNCIGYLNLKKTEIYNRILSVMMKGGD